MPLAHILVCHSVRPDKLFASIPQSEDALWFVFFHGDDVALMSDVSNLVAQRGGNFFPYMSNRGLAKSWNDGIHLAAESGCEAYLLLNDDMFFYDGGYNEFCATIRAINKISNNVSFVSLMGLESGSSPLAGQVVAQSFACCAITPAAIREIGYFDQNFTPAYYEDVDFARRAALANMSVHIDPRILVEHERSSTSRVSETIRAAGEKAFVGNRAYFELKWGGSEGNENYERPFNSSSFDLKINFLNKDTPYGEGFDRTIASPNDKGADEVQWQLPAGWSKGTLKPKNVHELYRTLLLRQPDTPQVVDDWVESGISFEDLRRQFMLSKEFFMLESSRLWLDRSHANWTAEKNLTHVSNEVCHASQREATADVLVLPDQILRLCDALASSPELCTIFVVGGPEDDRLALRIAQAVAERPITIFSNAVETSSTRGPANAASPPIARLALNVAAFHATLLRLKILPNLIIADYKQPLLAVMDVFDCLNERGALLYRLQSDVDAAIKYLRQRSAQVLGEATDLGSHVFVTRMIYPFPTRYQALKSSSIRRSNEKIALSAIVRDEEDIVEGMLQSCAGIVDYVSILDTGSTDRTLAIVRTTLQKMQVPHQVSQISFIDFAHARNSATLMIPEWIDWVLMLDADEYLVDADKQALVDLTKIEDVDAWYLPRYNFLAPDTKLAPVSYPDRQGRFFRKKNGRFPQFANKLHEMLAGDLERGMVPGNAASFLGLAGGPHIHHLGLLRSTIKHLQKVELYRSLMS